MKPISDREKVEVYESLHTRMWAQLLVTGHPGSLLQALVDYRSALTPDQETDAEYERRVRRAWKRLKGRVFVK